MRPRCRSRDVSFLGFVLVLVAAGRLNSQAIHQSVGRERGQGFIAERALQLLQQRAACQHWLDRFFL
jgi:hypothetical protein